MLKNLLNGKLMLSLKSIAGKYKSLAGFLCNDLDNLSTILVLDITLNFYCVLILLEPISNPNKLFMFLYFDKQNNWGNKKQLFQVYNKNKMQKKKDLSCLLLNDKSKAANDYKKWLQEKKATESVIKQLQKQSKILKAQIDHLSAQNQQLEIYKQKWLSLESTLSPSRDNKGNELRTPRIQRNQSEVVSIAQTQEGSISKIRDLQYLIRTQKLQELNQNDRQMITQKINSLKYVQKKSSSRGKRFNYMCDADQIALRDTFGSLNKTCQLLGRKDNFNRLNQQTQHKKDIKTHLAAFLHYNRTDICTQTSQIQQHYKESQKLQEYVHKLQKQLSRMKQIQSKLLDRIKERDEIIDQLKSLVSSKDQKELAQSV